MDIGQQHVNQAWAVRGGRVGREILLAHWLTAGLAVGPGGAVTGSM